jgi:hypothetical protein
MLAKRTILLAVTVALGCSSHHDHPALALGDTGWAIEAPPGWTVHANEPFDFTIQSDRTKHQFEVLLGDLDPLRPGQARNQIPAETIIASLYCVDAKKATSGVGPHGGTFAQCVGKHFHDGTQTAEEGMMYTIRTDAISTGCTVWGSPPDPEDVAVCKSLHKAD